MNALLEQLRKTKLFSRLSLDHLKPLLERSEIHNAAAGELIVSAVDGMHDHVVVVQGELEVQRTWTAPDSGDQIMVKIKRATENNVALISPASNMQVRALSAARYILIDADTVDEMLGWSQQIASVQEVDPQITRRMGMVKQVNVFNQLPLENVRAAFGRMNARAVEARDTIITQGEKGDCYYLIDCGEADVWRTDPFTDETAMVARLGPGDAFGEEALLQDGMRNATVKMITSGKLLELKKGDFDELVQPGLVEEISPQEALDRVNNGEAEWLDCRYDMEYEDSRLPGAPLIPLDQLREQTGKLDPNTRYVVYCRSGRRSKAAAFILRERNFQAVSLTGGIRDWPFEVDAKPVTA